MTTHFSSIRPASALRPARVLGSALFLGSALSLRSALSLGLLLGGVPASLAQTPPAAPTISPAAPAEPAPPKAGAEPPPAVAQPSGTFVNERRTDQWLASVLRSKNVYDRSDERIGAINDLVIDRNGAVSAVVIGVGGFLGIGEKNVGVPFRDIKISIRDGNEWLVLERSKDELKAAPAFSPTGEKNASRPSPSERPVEATPNPAR